MQYVADLHLHSKYSRAVSQQMILPVMAEWALKKGIHILTPGDWTHPLWLREIKSQLQEINEGLFQIKSQIQNNKSQINSNDQSSNNQKETLFILSTEISSIYSQGGKTRRIHNLIFSPSIEICEKINAQLLKRGCNLSSDGRPIIGISSKNLLEMVLSIDKNVILVPAHAWTPWFALYGSNSGFDSIDECFEEHSKYIYAVETGLSSDPAMNWGIKELENRSIISFSDAHSPAKMGREATVFISQKSKVKDQNYNSKVKITYEDIAGAIKSNPKGNLEIGYTIEFYPEEGKYHYDGHRNCKVSRSPKETRQRGSICPVCNRPLTIGVEHRVSDLSDPNLLKLLENEKTKIDEFGVKWIEDSFGHHPPFVKLVPLLEILAESLGSTVGSVKVESLFNDLCTKFGGEISVLLKTKVVEIEKIAGPKVAEGIAKVRSGQISIEPGFDGEYGRVKIWQETKVASEETLQMGLDF